MKKKLIIILVWIMTILSAFGCGFLCGRNSTKQQNVIENPDDTYAETANDKIPEHVMETEYDEEIIEIPISNIEALGGITQREAEELCYSVLGDKDEGMTGFPISYRCVGAVSKDNKQYYVMYVSWLVDDHHWSYIGDLFVSANGDEIYDGLIRDAEYLIMDLRWSK